MVYEFHSGTELQVAEKMPKLVSTIILRRTSPPRNAVWPIVAKNSCTTVVGWVLSL